MCVFLRVRAFCILLNAFSYCLSPSPLFPLLPLPFFLPLPSFSPPLLPLPLPLVLCAQPVLSFVQANLNNDSWQFRDASLLAFGGILSGPSHEKLSEIVMQAAMPIINLIQDPSVVVQDSVAWILGTSTKMAGTVPWGSEAAGGTLR